jgi:hypothetical protein
MKNRPNGFLSNEKIDHDSEVFDYIKELHEYLWRFVRCEIPGANGKLSDLLDDAIKLAEKVGKLETYVVFFVKYTAQGYQKLHNTTIRANSPENAVDRLKKRWQGTVRREVLRVESLDGLILLELN